MNHTISFICEFILAGLIIYNLVSAYLKYDKALIWSPITTISLTYVYYCSIPFWGGGVSKLFAFDEDLCDGYLFHIAAIVSYVFIMIGFYTTKNERREFKLWNSALTKQTLGMYGLILFIIAILGYSSVRGFHVSIAYEDNIGTQISTGGFTYYFVMLLDMMPFVCALLLMSVKNGKYRFLCLFLIVILFIQLIVSGARWRIVVASIAMLSVYYLYPKVKKANLIVIGVLGALLFFAFSIMDHTRVRSGGIRMDVAQELTYEDVKSGANENYVVYRFSMLCMNNINTTGERIYFLPELTAILMPIPRALFPWKPDAAYIHKIEQNVGLSGGAAFLNFVESFYSFGWIGVAVLGWFLGWLSRRFWDNYSHNRDSLGAIVALAIYSGVCYMIISRGFIASSLTTYLLSLCLPFWIILMIRHRKKEDRK